jgi:hypothetical protein
MRRSDKQNELLPYMLGSGPGTYKKKKRKNKKKKGALRDVYDRWQIADKMNG